MTRLQPLGTAGESWQEGRRGFFGDSGRVLPLQSSHNT